MTLVIDAVISREEKCSGRRNHSRSSSVKAKSSPGVQSSVAEECSTSSICDPLSSEIHVSSIGTRGRAGDRGGEEGSGIVVVLDLGG